MPIDGMEQGSGTPAGAQGATPKLANVPEAPVGQSGTQVPPFSRTAPEIPPEAMEMTKMLFMTVVLLVLGVPIVRAWIRRFDRKSEQLKAGPLVNIEPQIRQLQDSIDGLALEVERIAEGQRFMAKLIGDREKIPASLPAQTS